MAPRGGAAARPRNIHAFIRSRPARSSRFVAQFDLLDLHRWRLDRRRNATGVENAILPLQALLHGATDDDWRAAQGAVERVARDVNQLLVVSWTPYHWGPPHADDDLRHVHVLQRTVNTRSGYQELRDSGVVWAL